MGERHLVMMTHGSMEPKHITFQVTDVHKALFSLSKCADVGIESVFGKDGGYLYDTQSGERFRYTAEEICTYLELG